MAMKRSSKSPDRRPSRLNYWASKRLEKHKVKHIMKSSGLTRAQATEKWEKERGGRRMKTKF